MRPSKYFLPLYVDISTVIDFRFSILNLSPITFVSEQHSQVQAIAPTLTEEEQVENEQSVLDDLEMFG